MWILIVAIQIIALPFSTITIAENGPTQLENNKFLVEDYELIIDFYFGQKKLTSNVFIFTPPEATLIPLQPILDALEFPIEVDPISLNAQGWYINEKHKFDLDINQKELRLNDKVINISENSLIFSDGLDIYVDIKLLQAWLPITLQLDTSRLRLNIESTEKLPFESKLEREKLRGRALHKVKEKQLPIIEDEYRWIGLPTMDINAGSEFIDERGSFYSVQGSADMLGFEGRFSLNKPQNNSHSNKRLTLNKKPNAPGQTLALGVNNISLGDIYATTDSLIFQGGEGAGLNIEFGTFDVRNDFGKTVIEGEGKPGWEVELYKNGVLVDFSLIDNSGRYRFEDVSVEYGENIFDIRIFGPQGQTLNRRESVRVGDEMLPAGDNYAQISYVETGNALFDSYNETTIEKKTHMQWTHGISDHIAAGFAFANYEAEPSSEIEGIDYPNLQNSEDAINYAELSLNGSFSGFAMGADIVHNDSKGWATALNGQTGINDVSLSFLHKHYDDFISDRNKNGDLNDEIEMRLTSFLQTKNMIPIHYNFVLTHDSYEIASAVTELDNRLGFQVYSGMLTLNTTIKHIESQKNRLYGELNYSRALDRTRHLRTSVNYELHPKASLETATMSLSWHPTSRIRTQMGLNLGFNSDSTDSLNLSASALFDSFSLSLSSDSREDGYNAITFTIETSLGAESTTQWSMSGDRQSNNGRARIRTYLDKDQNGTYSEGDEAISGVKFTGRSNWSKVSTNTDGILYLNGLNSYLPNRLKVNEGSMEDPFWKAKFNEIDIISHAGAVNEVDIPVAATVEVEGSISVERNGASRPIPGLLVTISTPDGKPVATTQTEFDGYYVIAGLAPGRYIITFDNKVLKRLHIDNLKPVSFQAKAADGVVYIDPIVIK